LIAVGAICGGREPVAQAQDLQPQVILISLHRPSLETISFLPSGIDEPVLLLTDIIETMPAEFGSEALG
jgi:AmiR/NasT family two-component response regulator